jgi:hypothetical protein
LASGIALRAVELGFPGLIFFQQLFQRFFASGIAPRTVELGFLVHLSFWVLKTPPFKHSSILLLHFCSGIFFSGLHFSASACAILGADSIYCRLFGRSW